jgi:hypothetical protein
MSSISSNNNTKVIKIEGSNYELSEAQVVVWIERFGKLKSVKEEAQVVMSDDIELSIGTGVYLVQFIAVKELPAYVLAHNKHPNLLKVSYENIKSDIGNFCSNSNSNNNTEDEVIGKVTGNRSGEDVIDVKNCEDSLSDESGGNNNSSNKKAVETGSGNSNNNCSSSNASVIIKEFKSMLSSITKDEQATVQSFIVERKFDTSIDPTDKEMLETIKFIKRMRDD